ncbi:MAG: HD-GYP domain-containing protein [Clostridia bacterium]|nr:HD-GYP domain-containing protein [Clostridia bacterium]
MRRISIENCHEGMILGKTIFSDGSRILLNEGVELKQSYIERLKLYNVSEIYIQDELSSDIFISDVVDERTRIEAKALVKSVMEDCRKNSRIDSDRAKLMVDRIIDELLSQRDILVNLSDIKTTDDYTFAHSVNVCILSLITGMKLGLNQLRLKDLGVGALLHDIGKTLVPAEIIKKPGELTDEEYETVKQHTVLGHNILKADLDISISSAFVAFGHHERYDGSGYPMGLKGDNIHLFARIVAIADVYDALTSDRVYHKKMKNHEAIELITTVGAHQFDNEILQCFIKNIAMYSMGTGVILDTGERGIVVDCNKDFPTRPVIRIVYRANGEKVNVYEEIDLTKKLNVFVMDSCEL